MKRIALIILFFGVSVSYSQAYYGRGDVIFQVGANLQHKGSGIMASLDFGLGDNLSLGVSSAYLLGVQKETKLDGTVAVPEFKNRFDLKGRLNANLGNIINISDKLDLYPGLNVSLKNFGGHVGVRYFFTYGLGIFTEFDFPISKYNTDKLTPDEKLHNQPTFNIGLSFGL